MASCAVAGRAEAQACKAPFPFRPHPHHRVPAGPPTRAVSVPLARAPRDVPGRHHWKDEGEARLWRSANSVRSKHQACSEPGAGLSPKFGSPAASGGCLHGVCLGLCFTFILEFLFQDITWQDEHSAPFSWETRVSWIKFGFVCPFKRESRGSLLFLQHLMDSEGRGPAARLPVEEDGRGDSCDG